mmetsp:Transcript_13626/g.26156  ORF Transcript_13626/g.26156 Transcript_13626/m.26156 type:complete len:321 (-) Transcript_13626:866-1828(-)
MVSVPSDEIDPNIITSSHDLVKSTVVGDVITPHRTPYIPVLQSQMIPPNRMRKKPALESDEILAHRLGKFGLKIRSALPSSLLESCKEETALRVHIRIRRGRQKPFVKSEFAVASTVTRRAERITDYILLKIDLVDGWDGNAIVAVPCIIQVVRSFYSGHRGICSRRICSPHEWSNRASLFELLVPIGDATKEPSVMFFQLRCISFPYVFQSRKITESVSSSVFADFGNVKVSQFRTTRKVKKTCRLVVEKGQPRVAVQMQAVSKVMEIPVCNIVSRVSKHEVVFLIHEGSNEIQPNLVVIQSPAEIIESIGPQTVLPPV